MKTLVFVTAVLFVCRGEAKKGVRFKPADGGIRIREVHDPDQSYHPEGVVEHKETPHYFEDDYELEPYETDYHVPSFHGGHTTVHYGGKYPYKGQEYKAYKKARKQAYKMNKKYKKKAYKRVKHAKYFSKWGSKLLKYAMGPVHGPSYDDYSFDSYDELYPHAGKAGPEFVSYEREVYQNPKKPRLVEVRVPKCKPTVQVPYSVTETLIKKHPITITKTKIRTTHIKVKEYVVNTETVTQRVRLPKETVTKYYTVTQRNYEPATPVYKEHHYRSAEPSTPVYKVKHVRQAPATPGVNYATLMSSLMEILAEVEEPHTSPHYKAKKAKKTP